MLVAVGLLLTGWLYARGTRRLWHSAGRGRGIRQWQVAAFASGIVAVVFALLSPLDVLADALFSAHMGQHLLLIVVAAPLFALANLPVALLWSVSRRLRVETGALARRLPWARSLGSLPVAFGLHSLLLWVWHVPAVYEAALRNVPLHGFEHLTLLASGYLFWLSALHGLGWATRPPLSSVLSVFALAAQCTGLGALITLSAQPWYTAYANSTAAYGLSPVDDQVLAGALMWVPAGFVYLALALLLLGVWLRMPAVIRGPAVREQPPRVRLPGA